MRLTFCPVCARHVRDTEQRCIFCMHLLAGGLCAAVALSAGCKGREVNPVAPAASPSGSSAEPFASPPPPEPASASAAAQASSVSAAEPTPDGSIGLGSIGTIGVYGPPPQADDAGVPNTRMVLSRAQFTGPAVPQADDVLGAAMPQFRRCYVRELQKNPRMAGTISATIELGKGGEITSVKSQKSGTLSESVRTCMAARLSSLKFQPPEGGVPSAFDITVKCDAQPR